MSTQINIASEGKFWRIVGIIWLSPATILVWLFYVIPTWLIWRDLVFVGWAQLGIAEFRLASKGLERWHVRLWRDWAGWSGPCVFITKELAGAPVAITDRTRRHEIRHCVQQFLFGVLFYPVYLLASVFIWLVLRTLHAYLDNPFERDARKAAGQPVYIPPENWPQGPRDRWPWW
jgi:hypothetical protein